MKTNSNTRSKQEEVLDNLFGFWETIGASNHILRKEEGFLYIRQQGNLWPNLMFGLNKDFRDWGRLMQGVREGRYPNKISLQENKMLEKQLMELGYQWISKVQSMCWDGHSLPDSEQDISNIGRVINEGHIVDFAQVASVCFGYEMFAHRFLPFLGSDNVQMFIQRNEGAVVSCGLLYLDSFGILGIHIIGTLPSYRGLGLGRQMTTLLLREALKLNPKHVVLVASEAGARIYSKMGFEPVGHMVTYQFLGT